MTEMNDTSRPGAERLYPFIYGYVMAQVIGTAVRLGIQEELATAARPVAELAAAVGADTDALRRLLRALETLKLVDEVEADQFALSGIGQHLCRDAPESLHNSVLFACDPAIWRAWGALEHTVRTGEPAFDHVHGKQLFHYLEDRPELGDIFSETMSVRARGFLPKIVASCDFSACGTIVDVGGGDGSLLAAILDANPRARGVLFDSAAAVALAGPLLAEAGVSGRCETRVGDFFTTVPPRADSYILKNILHDWDDGESVTILRNCRRAVQPGGRVLVLTQLQAEDQGSPAAMRTVISDIVMMVLTHGRERTAGEYEALFDAAGFRLGKMDLVDKRTGYYALEARPL